MDDNLIYVFLAFLVTWIVIGGYLWTLGRQVQNLGDEVDALTEGEAPSVVPPPRRVDTEQSAAGVRNQ